MKTCFWFTLKRRTYSGFSLNTFSSKHFINCLLAILIFDSDSFHTMLKCVFCNGSLIALTKHFTFSTKLVTVSDSLNIVKKSSAGDAVTVYMERTLYKLKFLYKKKEFLLTTLHRSATKSVAKKNFMLKWQIFSCSFETKTDFFLEIFTTIWTFYRIYLYLISW